MTQQPFVSIIIPTFNGGILTEITLSNCFKIKKIPVEVIVIDDGSTDGTPERLVQHFPSIRLHRLPSNSGSGSAGRNAGLALARGHYVKFLDHDDLIQPRGFKAECEEAMRTDADIVMARWGVVYIDGKGRFLQNSRRILTPPDPGCLPDAILRGESMPYTAAALYKRSFVADECWDASVSVIDDYDWFCRLALKGGKMSRIDTISYFWRLHPESIQGRSYGESTIYDRFMFARCRVYEKIEQRLQSLGQLNRFRRQLLVRRYYDCLRCHSPHHRALLAHMRRLDPDFVVDATYESDPIALWLIHRIGLPSFLVLYGFSRRFTGAVPGLRRRSFPKLLASSGGP
ncbi:MAG: glycosyltransferase family 2 protein [Cyanobacteriota bacterium]|nr:glycosyltransferase family 2 protein [Cyanobacteriota bacterium]